MRTPLRRRGQKRLRARIVWSTALISALAMTAMIGAVLLSLAAITTKSVDSKLTDRIGVISAGLATAEQDPSASLEGPGTTIDDTTWLYRNGAQLDGPRAAGAAQAVADSLATVTRRARLQRGDRVFLAAPVAISTGRQVNGVLVVSEDLEPYEATRLELSVGLVLLGLLVTVGATGIAAWTVSRTLQPVEAMALRAEQWSAQQLDSRFADLSNDDEIARLGQTLNVLLDRVAGALRAEQRLTAELAHELRTPLTALRGEAELAAMGAPEAAVRDRFERIVGLSDRMGVTIATLLDLARGNTSGDGRTTTPVSIVDSAVDQLPTRTSIAVASELRQLGDVEVAAPIELAIRALSPLLDNAIKHASSTVEVSLTLQRRTVTIIISDDGPGVGYGQTDPEELFAAGVRRGDGAGAGLGLSLARRTARSIGGEVTISSCTSPTSFALTLPRT